MNIEEEIKDRLDYFYKQTDGTYKFPNSAEGDLLKLVQKYFRDKAIKSAR